MKKLVLLLLVGLLCPDLSAQILLKGKFDARHPKEQVWDGRYLAYTYQDTAYFYDTLEDTLYAEPGHRVSNLGYKKGLYWKYKDGKFQLRRVGEEEPVLPDWFDSVSAWFGDSIVAWGERIVDSESNGGKKVTEVFGLWYEIGKGIVAQHRLVDIHRALDFDYQKSTIHRDLTPRDGMVMYSGVYRDGLISVRHPVSRQYLYLDTELQIIPGRYEMAQPFSEGMAAVMNSEGFWGFIDTKGEQVISYKFEHEPGSFHSGLARVGYSGIEQGFIDQKGVLVIPMEYNSSTFFYKGLAFAKKKGFGANTVFLNTDGSEFLFPLKTFVTQKSLFGSREQADFFPSQDIRDFADSGMCIFNEGFMSSIRDKEGNHVLDASYALIKDLVDGKVILVKGNYLGSQTNQEFFLWDIDSNQAVIRLSFTDF